MNKKENKKVGSSNSSNEASGKKKLKIIDKYEHLNGVIWYGIKRPFKNHPTYLSLELGFANHFFV